MTQKRENTIKTAFAKLLTTEENTPIPKLKDVYLRWIAGVKLSSKPNTVSKYEGFFRNHISCLQSLKVDAIDRATINSFTKMLIGKGLSNKTINDILIVLNMILNFAAEEYGIITPKIKYMREEKHEPRYLSVIEQKRLTNYLIKDIDIHKFGTLLAMYTGMRLGELCALRWEDITDNSIKINKTMMRVVENGKTTVITLPPKTESSVRIVPFPPKLLKYYTKFRGSGYVLSTKRLICTEPRYMQMKFDKYVAESGLQDVTFHTLRHTFATRCIEAGVDAKTVSELLGHADTKITLNRYVHSSFELKQTSIEKMQQLLA